MLIKIMIIVNLNLYNINFLEIFALTILLSSTFIYNSIGAIDESAI